MDSASSYARAEQAAASAAAAGAAAGAGAVGAVEAVVGDNIGVYSTSRLIRPPSLESGRSALCSSSSSSSSSRAQSSSTGDAYESSKRRKLHPVLKHLSYLQPVRSYQRGPRGRRPALFCTPDDHADAAARNLEESLRFEASE
jgi:hypothetical protein